jgi:hypothetical protein
MGDVERFERVLQSVEEFSPRLKVEADLLRMAFARLGGETALADEIEARRRQECDRNRPNPMSLDDRFAGAVEALSEIQGGVDRMSDQRRWTAARRNTDLRPLSGGLPTLSGLADVLRVDYDEETGPDDLTLATIRGVYERFGLHADALRMVDLELAGPDLPRREREDLLQGKARLLHELDRPEDARATLEPIVGRLTSLVESNAEDAAVLRKLLVLHDSEDLCDDPARALEVLRGVKEHDPLADVGGVLEAGLLFRLGRNEEAWALYRRSFETGMIRYTETTEVFRAGIAGVRAGQEKGQVFLRLGLWRSPFHELAATARELLK